MSRQRTELEVFFQCPGSMQVFMQVLIVSNMMYALVLPAIEIFVAAYVMRNARTVAKVVTDQLSIDAVFRLESRNEYAYIFNHEIRPFAGRCLGCGLFLGIAYGRPGDAALKYALPVIALLQLLSIRVAGQISRGLDAASNTSPTASFTGHAMEA